MSRSDAEHMAHLRTNGAHHTKMVTRALTDEDCLDSAEQTERAVRFILQNLSPEQRRERRKRVLAELDEKRKGKTKATKAAG